MHRALKRFVADVSAGVAIEYGILLPTFMAMLLGSIWTGNLLFAQNGLVRAVQFAARCAAVRTTVCTNSTTTSAYALSVYSGPSIAPAFTYSTSGCGHTVAATATFNLNIIPGVPSVPLKATACFP